MRGASVAFPDYSYYDTDQLLTAFGAGAARFRLAIDGLTEEELRAQPRGPEKWSIHTIIMHAADSELQGAFRVRKTWAESGSEWPVHDQDAWTREINYPGEPAPARDRALTLVGLVREQSVTLFKRATSTDWLKWGIHPEFGRMTLRNLLELYADHGERHIVQILESRLLLRRPVATGLPALLPRRLY
jgi:hypothetical protein